MCCFLQLRTAHEARTTTELAWVTLQSVRCVTLAPTAQIRVSYYLSLTALRATTVNWAPQKPPLMDRCMDTSVPWVITVKREYDLQPPVREAPITHRKVGIARLRTHCKTFVSIVA